MRKAELIDRDYLNSLTTKDGYEAGTVELVTGMIQHCRIPANLKGYHYLRYAIVAAYDNPNLMDGITKLLYPLVASKFQTTPSRVERAIRHALETGADTVEGLKAMGKYAGCFDGVPSNSQFIAGTVDRLYVVGNRLPFFTADAVVLKSPD